MPLSKAQIQILTNPAVRKRLPARASDFKYADTLIRDVGEGCPRLPAVWNRVFANLSQSDATWLNQTFPGHLFTGIDPKAPPQALPPLVRPTNIVHRAIEVLQSYKKAK